MSKLRVAVLFGGVSSEHEVSLVSASSVIKNIPADKYDIIQIGITKKGRWLFYPGEAAYIESGEWELNPDCVPAVISPDRSLKGIVKLMSDGTFSLQKIDIAFPVLHGKNGEDGTIQGLLTLAGIPYVGCDTMASAACMDKAVTKILLSAAGIKNTPWHLITSDEIDRFDELEKDCARDLGYPMFVKPSRSGSSVGINKACDKTQLKNAINIALAHDSKVLIEKAVSARELECSVLGNRDPISSEVGEIVVQNEFYDYDAKYILGNTRLDVPAQLEPSVSDRVRAIALDAYRALGCSGMARVDFFLDKDSGDIILNEINTIPGFTPISMYPKLFGVTGIPYPELLDRLLTLALERADY